MKALISSLLILAALGSCKKENSNSETPVTPQPVPPTNILAAYSRWAPDQIMTVNIDTKDTAKKYANHKNDTYNFKTIGKILFDNGETLATDSVGTYSFITDTTLTTTGFVVPETVEWTLRERNGGSNIDMIMKRTSNMAITVYLRQWTQ